MVATQDRSPVEKLAANVVNPLALAAPALAESATRRQLPAVWNQNPEPEPWNPEPWNPGTAGSLLPRPHHPHIRVRLDEQLALRDGDRAQAVGRARIAERVGRENLELRDRRETRWSRRWFRRSRRSCRRRARVTRCRSRAAGVRDRRCGVPVFRSSANTMPCSLTRYRIFPSLTGLGTSGPRWNVQATCDFEMSPLPPGRSATSGFTRLGAMIRPPAMTGDEMMR